MVPDEVLDFGSIVCLYIVKNGFEVVCIPVFYIGGAFEQAEAISLKHLTWMVILSLNFTSICKLNLLFTHSSLFVKFRNLNLHSFDIRVPELSVMEEICGLIGLKFWL